MCSKYIKDIKPRDIMCSKIYVTIKVGIKAPKKKKKHEIVFPLSEKPTFQPNTVDKLIIKIIKESF